MVQCWSIYYLVCLIGYGVSVVCFWFIWEIICYWLDYFKIKKWIEQGKLLVLDVN